MQIKEKLKLDKDEAPKKCNRLISEIFNEVDKNKKIEANLQKSPLTISIAKTQTLASFLSSSYNSSSISILKNDSIVDHVCRLKDTDGGKKVEGNKDDCDCEIVEFVKGDSTIQTKLTNFMIKSEKI